MADETTDEKIARLEEENRRLRTGEVVQLSRTDLASMSAPDRAKALKDGRLKDLLSGS